MRKSMLDFWAENLCKYLNFKREDIRQTSFLLAFKHKSISIDLVALRCRVDVYRHCPADMNLLQMERDFEAVKSQAKEGEKDLNLSVPSLIWMQKRSEFCRDLARLAKFWTQTVLFSHKVWGMSLILELLAVKAAMKKNGRRLLAITLPL